MRGIVAKKIRKEIYGDMSIRDKKYMKDGETIRAIGLRAEYQKAKREHKD